MLRKKLRNTLKLAILIPAIMFLVVVLAGCFSSNISLHDGKLKQIDHRLTGLWFMSKNWHTQVYMHIVMDHDKNMRVIRVVNPVSNRGERIQLDEFYIFPTKISNTNYMNIEFTNQDGDKNAYKKKFWFVKYELTSPTVLKVWSLRHTAVVRAIQAGKLSGRAWLNGKQKRISLYGSREDLVGWLSKTKDRIDWNTPEIYKRLNKASYREY